MNRVELVFSQALEEDFIEAFRRNMIQKFTELPAVRGHVARKVSLSLSTGPRFHDYSQSAFRKGAVLWQGIFLQGL